MSRVVTVGHERLLELVNVVVDDAPVRRFRFRWTAAPRDHQDGERRLVMIGLNPSTGDELADDATLRRVRGFARAEGARVIEVVNLFPIRSQFPKYVLEDGGRYASPPWAIERQDAETIDAATAPGAVVVAAWGVWSGPLGRAVRERVTQLAERLQSAGAPDLQCWGTGANGDPRHPLYMPASARLHPWRRDA